MSGILITNVTNKDKEPVDYYNNKEFKKFGISDGFSTLVPMYKELLKEVLGNRVEEFFQDLALSVTETKLILVVFEREIKKLLEERDASKIDGFARREIFGTEYFLDLKLNPNSDRTINNMYQIYLIAEECLKENKPMYVSID